jgi:hypothetical protein
MIPQIPALPVSIYFVLDIEDRGPLKSQGVDADNARWVVALHDHGDVLRVGENAWDPTPLTADEFRIVGSSNWSDVGRNLVLDLAGNRPVRWHDNIKFRGKTVSIAVIPK